MDSRLPTSAEEYFWDGIFPFFGYPAKVGEYSLDERGNFNHDNSQKKYIIWPFNTPLDVGPSADVHFDLNLLAERAVRRDESRPYEKINNLLRWILENQSKLKPEERKAPFDR